MSGGSFLPDAGGCGRRRTGEQQEGEMAHTPGPWVVHLPKPIDEQEDDGDGQIAIHMGTRIKSPGYYRLAHEIVLGEGMEPGQNPEMIANAYLIAAAPDMYEALRHILEAIDTCGDDAVHYALANHQTLGDVVSEARAALAKARAAKAEG